MTIFPVLGALFVMGVIGISIGTYVNLRSVQQGHGPSPTGIAIQVATIATGLLALVLIGLLVIVDAGFWPAVILLVLFVLPSFVLVIGAIQGFKTRRRP